MQVTQPLIDIRSDVLTKPPKEMLKAISQAELRNDGDLNSLDDVSAVKFQQQFAELFGKQAAIIFPTATMCNIAAVMLHTQPGSQVIIPSCSHALQRQSGGFVALAGVQTRQVITSTGLLSVQDIRKRIRKEAQHITFPNTDLIFLENATFRGHSWKKDDLLQIKKLAEEKSIKVHIDGARIFNALHHHKLQPRNIQNCYDTMSVCLSKGLGCPFGAVILGSKAEVVQLKQLRKALGGGLWHNGLIAAAGSYALKHMVPEIKKDNQMAKLLAQELSQIEGLVVNPQNIHSNMVHWSVEDKNFDHRQFKDYMMDCNIKIKAYDEDTQDYRFAVYSSIREKQIQNIVLAIRAYFIMP